MRRILFSWAIAATATFAAGTALAGQREDEATAEQIATLLRDSGKLRNYSVGVKYKAGSVWLSGRVASNEQMQSALSVVSEIDGVKQIINNLSVAKASPAGRQPLSTKTPARAASTRRVSATTPDYSEAPVASARKQAMPAAAPVAPAVAEAAPVDGQATQAGFHRLGAKHAALHAPPPPMYLPPAGGVAPPAYDQPHMPNYAWPSYAAYPNYAALTYPKQYSPTAWPFIGPFYPYPQVPLGWRKVALEWDDGWWFLDFYDRSHH